MKKTLAMFGLVLMVLAASPAYATDITLTVGPSGPYILGEVIPGIQAGGQVARDVVMVNNLLSLGLNVRSIIDGREYFRADYDFGTLPAAVSGGAEYGTTGDSAFVLGTLRLTLTSRSVSEY